MNESSPAAPSGNRIGPLHRALDSLRLGLPQIHKGITVFPVFLPDDVGPDYLPLDDALGAGLFRVTEVSEGGSVPNLRVVNDSGHAVLIVDGEELLGAKQNRVVNATFLLPAGYDAVVPVSCTEQGRWRYTSAQFSPSDVVMELRTRRRKSSSVSLSLFHSASYASDQGEVWDSIHALHAKAGHLSPTSAMHDVYLAHRNTLAEALASFPLLAQQHGLLVFLGGEPAGFELVSRSNAYARLHSKLIRSYTLDSLLDPTSTVHSVADQALPKAFISKAGCGPFRAYPSVGLGESLRTEGLDPVGAALIYQDHFIHAAFFADGGDNPAVSQAKPNPQGNRHTRRHGRLGGNSERT